MQLFFFPLKVLAFHFCIHACFIVFTLFALSTKHQCGFVDPHCCIQTNLPTHINFVSSANNNKRKKHFLQKQEDTQTKISTKVKLKHQAFNKLTKTWFYIYISSYFQLLSFSFFILWMVILTIAITLNELNHFTDFVIVFVYCLNKKEELLLLFKYCIFYNA